jgi:sugar fermentation stimulation protein A
MKFPAPLLSGTLIQRYKRFLADIRLADGTVITATCPNTGSMLGVATPGSRVWVSESDSPTRKYKHTWELVEVDIGAGPAISGINTNNPNKLVVEAIEAGKVKAVAGYASLKREQKYGVNSRIDILLEDPAKGRCFVEVKNVHLVRKVGLAEFPDSVTERGVKHLGELAAMVREGHRAVMVYLIQRGDCTKMSFARDIDPAYAAAFATATAAGVEAVALKCHVTPEAITVDRVVKIVA